MSGSHTLQFDKKNENNVTHNNIITANNVIINYTGGEKSPGQSTKNSALPYGVHHIGQLTESGTNDPPTSDTGAVNN